MKLRLLKLSDSHGGPDEHSRECPTNGARSRVERAPLPKNVLTGRLPATRSIRPSSTGSSVGCAPMNSPWSSAHGRLVPCHPRWLTLDADFDRRGLARNALSGRARLARAKAAGKRFGRPPIPPEKEDAIRAALSQPGRPGVRKIGEVRCRQLSSASAGWRRGTPDGRCRARKGPAPRIGANCSDFLVCLEA
jgi:hypothetical protein